MVDKARLTVCNATSVTNHRPAQLLSNGSSHRGRINKAQAAKITTTASLGVMSK